MQGDTLELLYEPQEDEDPIVHALKVTAAKLTSPKVAYRFQSQKDDWPRYYDDQGNEIEARLRSGPIQDYEQVTSLLGDGRGHKGVDFKTPVGSPIKAPFDGVVVKRNWNTRQNGNCLKIRDRRTGTIAYLLHLDRIPEKIRRHAAIKTGQLIAYSGNTGRSSAPHLHYQLERHGRTIDPFKFHRTFRATLDTEDRDAFQDQVRIFANLGIPK